MKWISMPLLCLVAATALADAPTALRPFSDYQVILNRKPFGDVAANAAPAVERVVPVSESFAASMALVAIYEEEAALRAAIVDRRSNDYFSLLVGESKGDIELIDVDYERQDAALRKGDEVVVLSMRVGSAPQVLSSSEREELSRQAADRQMSYQERRRARQLARQQPREIPKPVYTGKELEEHLQNYQMEVLRKGMPPLPVQLTADRDAQLVEEGVLPPVDAEGYELDLSALPVEEPYYDDYYEDDYYDDGY